MRIRLIREWHGSRRGRILDVPDGQANLMVARGMAEVVDDEPAVPENAMLPPSRPRGRPRKVGA